MRPVVCAKMDQNKSGVEASVDCTGARARDAGPSRGSKSVA